MAAAGAVSLATRLVMGTVAQVVGRAAAAVSRAAAVEHGTQRHRSIVVGANAKLWRLALDLVVGVVAAGAGLAANGALVVG